MSTHNTHTERLTTDEQLTESDDPPTCGSITLSDGWKASRSAERSDPDSGEPVSVDRVDAFRFRVRVGDGGVHLVTLYTYERRLFGSCDCRATCQDCAHVLALVRQRDELGINLIETKWRE